jgi:hypothetical protein
MTLTIMQKKNVIANKEVMKCLLEDFQKNVLMGIPLTVSKYGLGHFYNLLYS